MTSEMSSRLKERVHDAIKHSPYLAQRNLRCETDCGRVVLRGKVKTYFQKQMAQEVVRQIDGIEAIENHLEVDA